MVNSSTIVNSLPLSSALSVSFIVVSLTTFGVIFSIGHFIFVLGLRGTGDFTGVAVPEVGRRDLEETSEILVSLVDRFVSSDDSKRGRFGASYFS